MQEDPSCSNACNGMSRQTQQALACLDSSLNPQTIPPQLQDLVTDPIEPQGAHGAQLLSCFEERPDVAGVVAVRQCGAVRCANAAQGASTAGCCVAGGALETTGIDSRRNSICPLVLCTADANGAGATFGDASMCGCPAAMADRAAARRQRPRRKVRFRRRRYRHIERCDISGSSFPASSAGCGRVHSWDGPLIVGAGRLE